MPAGGNGKQKLATKEKTGWPVAHQNKYIGDKRGKKNHMIHYNRNDKNKSKSAQGGQIVRNYFITLWFKGHQNSERKI